tara:strand:+ start:293 stop:634 length:342 start_codon:yes stop_codon:yes gene_type:complete
MAIKEGGITMKVLITVITINLLMLFAAHQAQADLITELKNISAEAQLCIEAEDCEDFMMSNPMLVKVLGNPDYVEELLDCNIGTKCYAHLSHATGMVFQASNLALDQMYESIK